MRDASGCAYVDLNKLKSPAVFDFDHVHNATLATTFRKTSCKLNPKGRVFVGCVKVSSLKRMYLQIVSDTFDSQHSGSVYVYVRECVCACV